MKVLFMQYQQTKTRIAYKNKSSNGNLKIDRFSGFNVTLELNRESVEYQRVFDALLHYTDLL